MIQIEKKMVAYPIADLDPQHAATLIFTSGHGSAISSAEEGKSGFIYNFVQS